MASNQDVDLKGQLTEEARLKAKEKEKEDLKQNLTREKRPQLPAEQSRVYREALNVLNESGVNYAVGAAFARYVYTSIWRQTKDLDIFVKPADLRAALDALRQGGFETEVKDRSWLAKAWKDGSFLDLIFGTGHGQVPIDDGSFEGSHQEKVLGVPVNLIPIEEMIASAAYVAGRNRFDGPEIAHLIHSVKGELDWKRILNRMDNNRELLLWHLVLFDFLYPGHPDYLPQKLMVRLFNEARKRWKTPDHDPKAFRGTLLDPFSYTVDVEDWGYEDRRVSEPLVDKQGNML
ncbi:MAG: nucleotidyl transferase [Chloroflexi bacterium]|nr:MAG: nucleotidyl transferase [Chloroflexota bacterium]